MAKWIIVCAVLGISAVAFAEGRQRCMSDCEIASRPVNCKANPAECKQQRESCESSCPK